MKMFVETLTNSDRGHTQVDCLARVCALAHENGAISGFPGKRQTARALIQPLQIRHRDRHERLCHGNWQCVTAPLEGRGGKFAYCHIM
jgi:hypothetical protein